jgi:hypothetical protein
MESSIKDKIFPQCANEALAIIRSNFTRFGRKELGQLANEYIFFNEYNPDQNIWIKVGFFLLMYMVVKFIFIF